MATPHTLSLENAHSFGLRGSAGRVEDKTCTVLRSPSSLQAAPSSSVYQQHMYTSPLVAAMSTSTSANFEQYWSTECQANSDIDISQFLTPQISGDDPATNSDTQDDFSSSSSPYSDSSSYTSVLWSDDAQSNNQNHILHPSLPTSFSMSPRPFFSNIVVSPQLKRDDFLESPIEFDDINIFSHSIQTPSSSPNINLRSTPLMSRSPSFPIFPPTPSSFINSTFTFIARNNQTPSSHILESPSVSNNNANTIHSQYSENNNSPLSKSTSCLPPPAPTNTPTLINIKNTLNNININTLTSSSNASPPHSSQNSPTPVRKRSPTTSPKISPKKKLSNNVNNNNNNNSSNINNNNSNIPSPLSLRKVLASSANNTPSTSPTLSSRTPKKNSLTEPSKNAIEDEAIKPCELQECPVCLRDPPSCLQSCTPSWAAILRIVFYSLKICNPSKDFFNLRSNVYDFVNTHWKKICMGKTRSDHWKKQLQDTLAHNKKLFVSGADIYKQKGFWKLDDLTDPWEIPSGGSSQNWSSPQTPPKQRKIMQRFPFPPPPLNLNSPATPMHHTFQPNNKAEFNNFLRNKKQNALEETDEEEITGIAETDWSENEDEIYNNNSGAETTTEHGSENSHDSENESETQTQSSQQQQQAPQSFNYTFPASIHIPHNVRSRKRVKLTYSM